MTQLSLDEIISRVAGLDRDTQEALAREVAKAIGSAKWTPTVGPQADAYFSKADILLYGGQAAGGKTDLILGLAFTAHKRSLIMRKQYTDLSAIIERAIEINGTRKGYNGSTPPSLRTDDSRLLEFGACALPQDWQHWMGRPHDLLAIDEASQFLESQVRPLMAWVRTTEPSQRCRVVFATNPPLTDEGQWVFEAFRPWVDDTYEIQAKPGELLWYAPDEKGKDVIVDGPDEVMIGGRMVKPLSRTFIPAAYSDNPFIQSDYKSRLDALPGAIGAALREGNFKAGRNDDQFQLIPSSWIFSAQNRWTEEPPKNSPMCAMGVDVAQGGEAETVLACRYDGWFAQPIAIPGRETPMGSDVAGLVVKHRRNEAVVIIDMGGGYGGGAFEHLQANGIPVVGFKGSERSVARTIDRQNGFYNTRSEAWYRFREALDPDQEGGSPIALPRDMQLIADLVSPRYEVTPRGIRVEDKLGIVKRLGRSPDRGDAVVMAWSQGAKGETHGQIWRNVFKRSSSLKVLRGHDAKRRFLGR